MNFQQLRIVRETVRRNFNLTDVAANLYTSQSGVSKHIRDLEEELGLELYVRKGKRLLGLTEPGKELVKVVERLLLEAENIRNLSEQYTGRDVGQLTLATTHTQARYSLPPVVTAFKQQYPKVKLRLHQGSPGEILRMLREGEADIGVATEALSNVSDLVTFPYYRWHHGVIVPEGHPLSELPALTLEAIAEYPVITYHEGFTGRDKVDRAFSEAGLTPDIAMSALDADVIKSYVELGQGVGIIASMAFNPEREPGLRLLDASALFEENTTSLAVRRGHLLRQYAIDFLRYCSPELTAEAVNDKLLISGK
ncbi:CysB family HTH-type transcriptional regulator [Marinimicrobium sp. ARAG 43.8]|uniref:CysB family HTH-type transcriptional regulator n=1 Tax=Marinimicrobium sp. ARAG 43.8 TaxID=3418719 RepID=UPI003CF96D8F